MSALAAEAVDSRAEPPAFLDVVQSARGLRWVERLSAGQSNTAVSLAQSHGLSQLLARLLAARGAAPETLDDFLNPTLRRLMPDPSCLRDMDTAADRLVQAIRGRQRIAVFGDYDVDGAACAALLDRFLRHHGLEPMIHIPDRVTEGYGPSEAVFESLVEGGAELIISADCGTAAHGAIAHACALGADVIVLDHHQADEALPVAAALVNPNRHDDMSGQGHLAAAGVVFLFLVAVMRALRRAGWYGPERPECDLRTWLDLVALATVCDVVPLTGLNRAFVARGLEAMRARTNPGLRALADAAGLSAPPDAHHLGFVLGPRINAGGRIGDSALGYRLLSTDDDIEAAGIAATLDRLNAERRAIEAATLEEAVAQADRLIDAHPDPAVLLVQGEGWHRGVVGLVASRLVERFARPAIAIAWERDGSGTGSGRSLPGIDLGAAIGAAREQDLLVKGGGHAMAAGLTVHKGKVDALGAFLQGRLAGAVAASDTGRSLSLDGALSASAARDDFMEALERAGPFGSGNPQPRFAFPAHRCAFAKVVGQGHVRCSLTGGDGSRIGAIAFRAADTPLGALLLKSDGMPIHVAGHLKRDHWGGRRTIELVVEDAADATQNT